jgi:hypothetical protein
VLGVSSLRMSLFHSFSLSGVADVLVVNLRRYFFVPETRGLSLEQIDRMYRESSGMFCLGLFLGFVVF